MTGKHVFEKKTGISNRFVEEAAFIPEESNAARPRPRAGRVVLNWLNSAPGVAILCVLVWVSLVSAIVVAGCRAPSGNPSANIPGGDLISETDAPAGTNAVTHGAVKTASTAAPNARFIFEWKLASEDYHIYQGDTMSFYTSVTNLGEPFDMKNVSSSEFFAYARLLGTDENSTLIPGMFGMTDDVTTITVKTGNRGVAFGEFIIPAAAEPGMYDVELSFGGVSEIVGQIKICAESQRAVLITDMCS